jgi:hypothetical protein
MDSGPSGDDPNVVGWLHDLFATLIPRIPPEDLVAADIGDLETLASRLEAERIVAKAFAAAWDWSVPGRESRNRRAGTLKPRAASQKPARAPPPVKPALARRAASGHALRLGAAFVARASRDCSPLS